MENQPQIYQGKALIKKLAKNAFILGLAVTLLSFLTVLFMALANNEMYFWFMLGVAAILVFSVMMIVHNIIFGLILTAREVVIKDKIDYFKIFIPLFIVDFIWIYMRLSDDYSSGHSDIIPSLIGATILTLQAFVFSYKVLPKINSEGEQ